MTTEGHSQIAAVIATTARSNDAALATRIGDASQAGGGMGMCCRGKAQMGDRIAGNHEPWQEK